MVRASLPGRLPLCVALLVALTGTLGRGQSPAPDSGNQAPQTNPSPREPATPPSAQANPLPPSLSYPDTTPPGGLAEPSLPPPNGEGRQWLQEPLVDTSSRGGGGFAPFANPLVGYAPIHTDYRVTWLPAQPVVGQPTNLGYVQQDFLLSFPLWQCAKTDEWLATVNVQNDLFQTHAILPDTHQPFPDDLWNIRFGTSYRHEFDNGWISGGGVSFGSASDKPFHSINEMTAGVNAFLRIPQGEHNAWLFSLSYSPTSELPVPIPGVAFLWQPSEYFRANIGLPFSVMWRPTEDLTLDVSYMLLTTFRARTTYRLYRRLRLYAAYAVEDEGYFLADRVSVNDRFYNVDQRLTAGMQYILTPKTALDFSSGYIFDHHFFEGKNITDGTGFNRVDVGDTPYVAVQLRVRW